MEIPNDAELESQRIAQPEASPIPGTSLLSGQAETSHQETGPIAGVPALASQAETSHSVQSMSSEDVSPSILTETDYQRAMAPLKPQSATYWASLVLTGSIVPLPIAAAIITATFYITRPDKEIIVSLLFTKALVVFAGILGTLLLWLFIALPFKRFTIFDTANVRSASHLRRHILVLKSILKLSYEQVNSVGNAGGVDKTLRAFRAANPEDYDLALDTVCSCLLETNRQIENGNLSWIMGSGYIGMWNFVQRAEEALLAIAPREYVIREALHDEASVDGSTIADRAYILSNIKTSIKVLSPSAAVYLKSLSVQDRTVLPTSNNAIDTVAPPTPVLPAQNLVLNPTTELEARNALRDVRQTLNEFRSGLWEGLVTQRNQLVGTALITALLTFVLLFVAIAADINVEAMKAALIFYLVGAIVGLFSRLYTESQNDSAVDDYGLTVARVVVTPLISGLAAIAGVLVIAVLSINILNAPGTGVGGGLPQLINVYDIVQNRQGIIIASLFGLTPNLLMNILQQKADDAKAQLKGSSAPNQNNS